MGKIKLLLVDDMEWVYETARLKMSNRYDITYAKNATDALKKINEKEYDLVVTDYHLGNKSRKGGLRIIMAAKEKGLRAILMSMENKKEEAAKAGVKFIFKKNLYKLREHGRQKR